MQDGPHIYEGFEMKHTDKTPEGIMQGKPTTAALVEWLRSRADYWCALVKEQPHNGWLEQANKADIAAARLAAYEVALREISNIDIDGTNPGVEAREIARAVLQKFS